MSEQEEKGFIIKDRRTLSGEEGEAGPAEGTAGADEFAREKIEEAAAGPEAREQARKAADAAAEAAAGARREGGHLPQVSFSTFIFSLSSSALVHLGEIPDPNSQERQIDLPMAKQIIDTLGMIQDKTKGNLDPEEERMLQSVLYDLRMRYVRRMGG
jgi:hypothetical protein